MTAVPPPHSLYQWRGDQRCFRCVHFPKSAASKCPWCRTWLQRTRCNENAASTSATRRVTADTQPICRLCGFTPHRWLLYSAGTDIVLWMWGNHTKNYRGCVKWKEVKATLGHQTPERSRKSVAAGQTTAPKTQRASPSTKKMDLGE